jgi:protein-disulfide isomerase
MVMMLGINLLANDETIIKEFIQDAVKNNPRYLYKDVTIKSNEPISGLAGWKAYFVQVVLEAKADKKEVKFGDIIFTNGQFVAPDLINTKTKQKMKEVMVPGLDSSYYDKEHLIYGSLDAPNKVVIFSDPVCPFCIDFVPSMISEIQKSKTDKIALFYYHYPLTQIHPKAPTIVKAAIVAEQKGVKDVAKRVYEIDFDEAPVGDDGKILALFNKHFGTKITASEINKPEVIKHLEHDMSKASEAMVRGTPTVYFNGKKDAQRDEYKKYLK